MLNSHKKVLIALFVTTFLAAIEGTIVSTAMPAITNDLQGMSLFSWVNSVYLLAMVIAAPLYGKLSDLYGRKPIIIFGTVLFTVSSALAGLAWDMVSLIIFRAVQGLGGAALLSIPMIIISDLFELSKRSKIQGLLSSVWGVAGILGPLAGGLLVDFVSWRAVFYINVPFAVIALVLLVVYLPKQEKARDVKIDMKGIMLFTVSMLLFMFSLGEIFASYRTHILSGLLNSILFVFSFVLMYVFIKHENKTVDAFIPPSLFKNKLLVFSVVTGFIISINCIAVIYYIPLWVQDMQGHSATLSGLIMIPLSITWPLSSILAGYLVPVIGVNKVKLFGSVALIMSAIGFATLDQETSHLSIMIYISIAGFGYGLIFTTGTVMSSVASSPEQRGMAMSLVQVSRNLGQTIGLTVWGLFIFSNQDDIAYTTKLADSIVLVFILTGILTLSIVCYIVYMIIREKELSQFGLGGYKKREKQANG